MSISPASRISTRAAGLRQLRQSKQFRRGFLTTVLVLALACLGLGAASVLQGPRIQSAKVDATSAVSVPTPLRIVLDEAIAPLDAGDVTVAPDVPHAVSTDGDVVLVRFGAALDYDARYTVTLDGVHAAAGGVEVSLTHEFTTPPFSAAWLERAPSGDRILRGTPGGEPATLYTGAAIQDFLELPGALFVVSFDDAGGSVAEIVSSDGVNRETLTLPGSGEGVISVLGYVGTTILYTLTSLTGTGDRGLPEFDDALFTLDLSGTHISDPVLGVDGVPLAVDGIQLIPGQTTALLHTRSGDVLQFDVDAGQPPTLLTSYPQMVALAADGHRLSVKDTFGPLIYDLDDGTETRITPSPIAGSDTVPFIADVVPLSGGRWLERAAVPSADFTSFDVFVAIDDGTSATPLFGSDDEATVLGYRLTANERYLVAEATVTGNFPENSDGYPAEARPRDVTTVVIDLVTGDVVADWPGSHARW